MSFLLRAIVANVKLFCKENARLANTILVCRLSLFIYSFDTIFYINYEFSEFFPASESEIMGKLAILFRRKVVGALSEYIKEVEFEYLRV